MFLAVALTLFAIHYGTTIYTATKFKMNRVLAVLAATMIPIPFLIPLALIASATVSKAVKNYFNPPPTETEKEIQKINEMADKSIGNYYMKTQNNILAYDKLDQAVTKINTIRDKHLNSLTTSDGKPISAEMKNYGRIDQKELFRLCREGGLEYAMSHRQSQSRQPGQSKFNNQSHTQTKSNTLKR